jgi:hypothetical protein
MYCMHAWLISKFLVGSSLESLEADSSLYIRQMKGLKRDQAHILTKSWRQLFLNLLGRDNVDSPTRFSGKSFSSEELECFRDDPYVGPLIGAHQGILFTCFGEYVTYADKIIKVGPDHFQKAVVGSPNHMWDTFFKGISCFAAARATHKKKYAKTGKIFRSKMNTWLEMGNPNVKHYASLLDAEWTAFKGKKYDAIKKYESAILLAARGGYQQDAALATERFGEFYLNVMGDRDDAAYQIGQSIKYWRDWGAVAKVQYLEEKYGSLLPNHMQSSIFQT